MQLRPYREGRTKAVCNFVLKGVCLLHLLSENIFPVLTRALVGSFYNAIWWGGGLFLAPPRISGTTGPIYKTQAAFDSPGQFIERK